MANDDNENIEESETKLVLTDELMEQLAGGKAKVTGITKEGVRIKIKGLDKAGNACQMEASIPYNC